MNRQEKEAYLREYSILKSQGKPFFPYAVAKDGASVLVSGGRTHLYQAKIGADGRIQHLWTTVKPETHPAEVLAVL